MRCPVWSILFSFLHPLAHSGAHNNQNLKVHFFQTNLHLRVAARTSATERLPPSGTAEPILSSGTIRVNTLIFQPASNCPDTWYHYLHTSSIGWLIFLIQAVPDYSTTSSCIIPLYLSYSSCHILRKPSVMFAPFPLLISSSSLSFGDFLEASFIGSLLHNSTKSLNDFATNSNSRFFS